MFKYTWGGSVVTLALVPALVLASVGCGEASGSYDEASELSSSWAALLADGDVSAVRPDLGLTPVPAVPVDLPPPPRFCIDCRIEPLVTWTFDDCTVRQTLLQGASPGSYIEHPAFRAVETACAPGASERGVLFDDPEDVVYAPDQPDLAFTTGLTLAAFVRQAPSSESASERGGRHQAQTLVRKRFGGSSAFVLAIENGKLSLVLGFEDGTVAGVSAPLISEGWVHVAGTFDGSELRLYIDGKLAASKASSGVLASGAGPIFIGNDASGRAFRGTLDEVWVNSYAATPEYVDRMLCTRGPELGVTPSVTPPLRTGDVAIFDFTLTSLADARCPPESFEVYPAVPPQLETYSFGLSATVAPGETSHTEIRASSYRSTPLGEYPIEIIAFGYDSTLSGDPSLSPIYVVGEPPLSCVGTPVTTAAISGAAYSYGRPDSAWPGARNYYSEAGVFEALAVTVDTRNATLDDESVVEVGLEFQDTTCLDASAYGGIAFRIEGDLRNCGDVAFSAIFSQDRRANTDNGSCIEEVCRAPVVQLGGLGTYEVRFSDLVGGAPVSAVDPSTLSGIRWLFNPPRNEPCVADIAFRDIRFVE